MEEDSTDDLEMATAIEEQVLELSGISVELTTEDLQQWTTTYKEDKSYIAAYSKLCQSQKYEDCYLTPLGLLARMMGGQQKIIVPNFLRQQFLKECYNVPFTGDLGMCKTLQLVDRQFHW